MSLHNNKSQSSTIQPNTLKNKQEIKPYIKTKKISNANNFIRLTKIINNARYTQKNNKMQNNQLVEKYVIIVYSQLSDNSYYLNWVALIRGKNKYKSIRDYKLPDMKKGTIYKMNINIYKMNKIQYEQMDKKHLPLRKLFNPSILTSYQVITNKIIEVEHHPRGIGSTLFNLAGLSLKIASVLVPK